MVEAVIERFPNLDPMAQAMVVRFMIPTEDSQQRFARIHALAQRSDDALVRITYLATQVAEPDSPVIDAALRDGNEDVAAFAQGLRAALEQASAESAAASPAGQAGE